LLSKPNGAKTDSTGTKVFTGVLAIITGAATIEERTRAVENIFIKHSLCVVGSFNLT
jgi:hypothetical protein